MKRRTFLASIFLAAALPALASADTYPSRVVKIIVPWPAGGAADAIGRITADELSKILGQTVIVDNRPGAGTNIGSEAVARSEPDGYTLLIGSTNNAVNMTLYKSVRYSIEKDFEPIAILANVPNILVANTNVKAQTVSELIAYAKANPGKLKLATAGNGSPAHLAGAQFKRLAGVDMLDIPYKGAAPAVTDLLGGFVDVMFTNIPATLGHIKAGKLRAIGIGSKKRNPVLPDVPTISESGLPNYEATAWYGLLAPKGTPKEIIQKITDGLKGLNKPEIQQRFVQQGTELINSSPDAMAKQIRSDVVSYRELIESTGIQIE